ncbi:ABC transporter permease [Puniceicoccaceae bacterium K14]|nr:ABC transporter permease [Puniceicoccaceae bacterium K14]
MVSIIYSGLQGVIFQSVPLKDAERIVQVLQTNSNGQNRQSIWTKEDYKVLVDKQSSLEYLTYIIPDNAVVGRDGDNELVRTTFVNADFFKIFKTGPFLGRFFEPADMELENNQLVVISYSVWQEVFKSDNEIVGKTVLVDGLGWTVLGVTGSKFDFPYRQDLWLLSDLNSVEDLLGRSGGAGFAMGLLNEKVSLEVASQEIGNIVKQIASAQPEAESNYIGGEAIQFVDGLVDDGTKRFWLMLFSITILVLLIACSNVSSIMVGKSIRRQSEFALRMSLGASRWDVVMQLVAESLAIAILAIFGSLIFAETYKEIVLLPMVDDLGLPDWVGIDLNLGSVAFISAVAIVSVILSSIAPAFRSTKTDLQTVLKEGTRTGSSSRVGKFVGILIVFQVALAVVVLTAVSLLLTSTQYEKEQFDFYETDNVVYGRISLDDKYFPTPADRLVILDNLIQEVENDPAMSGIAISNEHYNRWGGRRIALEGQEYPTENDRPVWLSRVVSAGYFETMGIELIEGREFGPEDRHGAPLVALVSKETAERNWPGESATGKRFTMDYNRSSMHRTPENKETLTIVGVIPDVWKLDVYANEVYDGYVRPVGQETWSNLCLYGHGSGSYLSLEQSFRNIGKRMHPGFAITGVTPLDEVEERRYSMQNMVLKLILSIGSAAVLMVGGGLYGIISYATNLRKQEMAIRSALGASVEQNIALSFFSGFRRVLFGCFGGALGGVGLHFFLKNLIRPYHPELLNLLLLIMVLFALTSFAILIPAWRSRKIEPMEVLRTE